MQERSFLTRERRNRSHVDGAPRAAWHHAGDEGQRRLLVRLRTARHQADDEEEESGEEKAIGCHLLRHARPLCCMRDCVRMLCCVECGGSCCCMDPHFIGMRGGQVAAVFYDDSKVAAMQHFLVSLNRCARACSDVAVGVGIGRVQSSPKLTHAPSSKKSRSVHGHHAWRWSTSSVKHQRMHAKPS